jgi:hypothetical protein
MASANSPAVMMTSCSVESLPGEGSRQTPAAEYQPMWMRACADVCYEINQLSASMHRVIAQQSSSVCTMVSFQFCAVCAALGELARLLPLSVGEWRSPLRAGDPPPVAPDFAPPRLLAPLSRQAHRGVLRKSERELHPTPT